MNDFEINKALALAIGWPGKDVLTHEPYSNEVAVWFEGDWVRFNYEDWDVIGPIAERYNCFPRRNGLSQTWWPPQVVHSKDVGHIMEDTPQKAIAMAVIKRYAK